MAVTNCTNPISQKLKGGSGVPLEWESRLKAIGVSNFYPERLMDFNYLKQNFSGSSSNQNASVTAINQKAKISAGNDVPLQSRKPFAEGKTIFSTMSDDKALAPNTKGILHWSNCVG